MADSSSLDVLNYLLIFLFLTCIPFRPHVSPFCEDSVLPKTSILIVTYPYKNLLKQMPDNLLSNYCPVAYVMSPTF